MRSGWCGALTTTDRIILCSKTRYFHSLSPVLQTLTEFRQQKKGKNIAERSHTQVFQHLLLLRMLTSKREHIVESGGDWRQTEKLFGEQKK